jgi:hypothetical protein
MCHFQKTNHPVCRQISLGSKSLNEPIATAFPTCCPPSAPPSAVDCLLIRFGCWHQLSLHQSPTLYQIIIRRLVVAIRKFLSSSISFSNSIKSIKKFPTTHTASSIVSRGSAHQEQQPRNQRAPADFFKVIIIKLREFNRTNTLQLRSKILNRA